MEITSTSAVSIVYVIALGVWLPLVVYIYSRRRSQRYDHNLERDLERIRFEAELQYKYMGNKDFSIGIVPKILEDLPNKTSIEVSRRLSRQIDEILNENLKEHSLQLTNKIARYQTNENNNFLNNKQLIREIAHSLNTPLSRIEASSEIILTSLKLDDKNLKTLKSIKSSVDLCKAFISAYRQMILVTGYSGGWEPKSINNSIISACELYSESNDVNLKINVELPNTIKGYSNNYIVALLLPLIENATEAAKPYTEIKINFDNVDRFNVIQITNTAANLPSDKKIFDAEFSTKDGHQGLGLSTVKSLLESLEDASIGYNTNADTVTFEIKLKSVE